MTYLYTDETGEEMLLGSISEVAAALGEATNQASMWFNRRARNGFPEPVEYLKASNGVMSAHFDIDAVRVWRLYYVPSKGGKPMHKKKTA